MDYEKTNDVFLSGKISKIPTFSHSLVTGEKFYEMAVDVERLSGTIDTLPVTVSEKVLKVSGRSFELGEGIDILGEFRSHNEEAGGKSKLILSVFAKELFEKSSVLDANQISLTGYICKPPIFRETPFKRQINDILLAVNRPLRKSDYIPMIAWGRNALLAKNFRVGDKVSIKGRIQSRKFTKVLGDETLEKTAYEVSIQDITGYEEKIESHISYADNLDR